jgi:hypothetical protein
MLKKNSKEKRALLNNFNAAFIINCRTRDNNATRHRDSTKLLINPSSVNQEFELNHDFAVDVEQWLE